MLAASRRGREGRRKIPQGGGERYEAGHNPTFIRGAYVVDETRSWRPLKAVENYSEKALRRRRSRREKYE